MRRLSRKSKDLACARQRALCGYCTQELCDAFHVDHMDENCANDAWTNLVACCGTCHARKTQHYRKGRYRELRTMLRAARANKVAWVGAMYGDLPRWLLSRCPDMIGHSCPHDACARAVGGGPFERYRYVRPQ